MFSRFTRTLQRIGLLPPPKAKSGRVPGGKLKAVPSGSGSKPDARHGHDIGKLEVRGKPAMAVIPRDAVQRMPPAAASPGLLPVDPVNTPYASPLTTASEGRTRSARPVEKARLYEDSQPAVGQGGPRDNFFSQPETGKDQSACPSKLSSGLAEAPPPITQEVCSPEGASSTQLQSAKEPSSPSEDASSRGPGQAQPILQGLDGSFFEVLDPKSESAEMAKFGAVDSLAEKGSFGVKAERRPRAPARIAARPNPMEWSDDELLTLPEAAALFWPDGPITTNTLRTAGRDGTLTITKVAGKFFTTPMAIRRMGLDEAGEKPKQRKPDETSVTTTLQMKIAEAQRLGGGRPRSRRAARGSVSTTAIGVGGQ